MFVFNRSNYDFVTFVQDIILISNLVYQNNHCQKYDNANQMRISENLRRSSVIQELTQAAIYSSLFNI